MKFKILRTIWARQDVEYGIYDKTKYRALVEVLSDTSRTLSLLQGQLAETLLKLEPDFENNQSLSEISEKLAAEFMNLGYSVTQCSISEGKYKGAVAYFMPQE